MIRALAWLAVLVVAYFAGVTAWILRDLRKAGEL